MTQKHVDLLLKAIAVPESCSIYLCDRLDDVVGYQPMFSKHVDEEFKGKLSLLAELKVMIRKNINYEFSFDDTPYAKDGMTREEWVETILVPLALELPEETQ